MKKRLLACLLSLTMIAPSLMGCGQESTEKESTVKESTVKENDQTSSAVKDQSVEAEQPDDGKPVITEPVTISILTTRSRERPTDAKDLWFFKYLEYWLNEQGYDVTLDVTQTMEPDTQMPLLLGSDSLPDIVWGIGLSAVDAVTYGTGGQILDWTPYLNEETMPNLMSLFDKFEGSYAACVCSDGAVYGLPAFLGRGVGQTTGLDTSAGQTFINTEWLDACGLEMPTTMDEFIDMLRAFKDMKLEDGQDPTPLIQTSRLFEYWIWACLGYYGTNTNIGNKVALKGEELYYPAATEDYKTYVTIMNTLYNEGLIPKDYLTTDDVTHRGMMTSGLCGVLADWTLVCVQENYDAWESLPLVEVDGVDFEQVAGTMGAPYAPGTIWVSADTEYPELMAYIMDWLYSPEGSVAYYLGPQKGQDPLGLIEDGWYYDENGEVINDKVKDGTYDTYGTFAGDYVYSTGSTGNYFDYAFYSKELAGLDSSVKEEIYTDAITGKPVSITWKADYVDDNVDGHMRWTKMDAWRDHLTGIRLPAVYLSEEDNTKIADIKILLDDYVKTSTAEFITGLRSLDELDEYYKELEALHVDEYLDMYKKAYAIFLEETFK